MKLTKYTITGFLILLHSQLMALPQHWVNAEGKTVSFIAQPKLTVALTPVKASKKDWAHMDIAVNYQTADIQQQIQQLKTEYPGFTVQRLLTQAKGSYYLHVPGLNLYQEITMRPGELGPYGSFVKLLSQTETEKLQRIARRSPHNLAQLKGKLSASVMTTQVLESKQLKTRDCENLLGSAQNMHDLIENYQAYARQLDQTHFAYAHTRKQFKKLSLTHCVDINLARQTHSFKELLSTPVRVKEVSRQILAQTKKQRQSTQVENFKYTVEFKQYGE